jgi:hypothetical protein
MSLRDDRKQQSRQALLDAALTLAGLSVRLVYVKWRVRQVWFLLRSIAIFKIWMSWAQT